jgi:energy-coupling factor transporter ATP-binding protein EcfA2
MNLDYIISNKAVIFNFSKKYSLTPSDILKSEAFKKILDEFLRFEKKNNETYLKNFKAPTLLSDLIIIFNMLISFEVSEIKKLNIKENYLLKNIDDLYTLVELFYDYWRKKERYAIVESNEIDTNLSHENILNIQQRFNDLLITLYRTISQKLLGVNFNIYRTLNAGVSATLLIGKNMWAKGIYKSLNEANFICSIVLRPPFITYSKKNTRKGIFKEEFNNPLNDIVLNSDEWFCYPLYVGSSLCYVYFHREYLNHGIALSNLFEFADFNKCKNQKPDLIYIFGAPIDKEPYFYYDKEEDIYIGVAPLSDEVDYFGYMKKMILTIHNVKMIEKDCLPIHGACVSLKLKNGVSKTLVLVGDSGAGKSETLEALRKILNNKISDMKTIFDDMGTFILKDEKVYAIGTETGAFVRLDDLENGYAYKCMDRAIFMNPDKTNSRLIMPVSNYKDIIIPHKVDIIFYANNYLNTSKDMILFNNKDEALLCFKEGKRMAKGTTQEKGITSSYFANPFGPIQKKEKCDILLDKYFSALFKNKVIVGEAYTKLGVDGYSSKGPLNLAKALIKSIIK